MLSRRKFLAAGSAAVATGALAGCASGPSSSSRAGTVPATPKRHDAGARRATLHDVDHVVILMQENRSFDQYFGTRPGVRGFADPKIPAGRGGTPRLAQPFTGTREGYLLPWHVDSSTTSGQCLLDADHSWESQHAALGTGGRNDGFASTMGAQSLGYFRRADLPYYWALADQFTLCDHSFCSVLGPTDPNRLMTWTATIDAAGRHGGPRIDNDTTKPYTWETYPERLQRAGISWRIYHEADDFDDNTLKYFAQFQGLPPTSPLVDAALRNRSADAFAQDAARGDLPQVSWIVAPEGKSEHAPFPPSVGEDYTARLLAALMANAKLWAKTLFVLTYDENGGYADHVPPPQAPPGTPDETIAGKPVGLGFRVPTTLVSPWTRAADGHGRVVSDVFDHTSILRLLETRFGVEVPNLSAWRRATTGDLSTALDLASFDASVPRLPTTGARADAVIKACSTLPAPTPPAAQRAPTLDH